MASKRPEVKSGFHQVAQQSEPSYFKSLEASVSSSPTVPTITHAKAPSPVHKDSNQDQLHNLQVQCEMEIWGFPPKIKNFKTATAEH